VWESIARPIYEYVHSLKILKKVELWVNKVHRTVLLVLFLLLFIKVEILGVAAMALLASGKIVSGVILYATKIPIGAFTFWLFKISKNKLMTFKWFKRSYDFVMSKIEYIKNSEIYKNIKKTTAPIKSVLREKIKSFKKLFSKDNKNIKIKIKKIYIHLKSIFKS
jgi:hypothetical protein